MKGGIVSEDATFSRYHFRRPILSLGAHTLLPQLMLLLLLLQFLLSLLKQQLYHPLPLFVFVIGIYHLFNLKIQSNPVIAHPCVERKFDQSQEMRYGGVLLYLLRTSIDSP